jgi:hypothetical protein
MWRDREWRKMLNLIDHLPGHSFFNEARANDPDIAKMLAEMPTPAHSERLSNWTPEIAMLAVIADRLGSLIVVESMIGSGGKSKPDIKPLERPQTLLAKMRESSRFAKYKQWAAGLSNPN